MQMVKVRLEIKEIKLHKRKPNHILWGVSSVGRTLPLQGRGRRFDPGTLHHNNNLGGYSVVGSGADCKSVAIGSGGSIPSPPTINVHLLKLVKRRVC